jgi:hypothetical protein
MNIVLNPNLVKVSPTDYQLQYAAQHKNEMVTNLAKRLGNKLDKIDGKVFGFIGSNINPADVETLQEGFVGLLSHAYSKHEKIEIAPHDIWYLVLSEIAIIIKGNVEACRPLFTKSQDVQNIKVQVADVTQIDLAAVVSQLRELIPVDVDVFVPMNLSTLTPESTIAMYAALCDGVSAYYSYSTFMCGIPEIRFTGTQQDWQSLLYRCGMIAAMFGTVNLPKAVEYMIGVGDIINEIQESFTAETPNLDFFKGIFTSKNVGSGGELDINGWITKLYYEKRKSNKLENFMNSVTVVSYNNLETGREFKGVYGAFERLRTDDDFVKAGYANLIFEVLAEKSKIIVPGGDTMQNRLEGLIMQANNSTKNRPY